MPQPPAAGNPSHHRRPGPAATHSLDSSVSDNTRTMYNSAWHGFESWTQARGALSLPASPPLVAAYLAHLAEELHRSVATVRLHQAAGHADPTDNEGVRQIIKGIARAHGKPQKQARPFTAEALAAVKATAGKRPFGGRGKGLESSQRASWRARVDVAVKGGGIVDHCGGRKVYHLA